jgi:putative FmdB family regulatory protein
MIDIVYNKYSNLGSAYFYKWRFLMPIYEYECASCGGHFDVTRKFSDPVLTVCKLCNASSLRKVLSPTAFVLKGSGWYATDYPSKDRKESTSTGKTASDPKPAAATCASGCCSGSCPPKAEP